MSFSIASIVPGMPSNNLLCRDCKHFQKNPERPPSGKCLKYPFVNPVNDAVYYIDVDKIRMYECKGRHWEKKSVIDNGVL